MLISSIIFLLASRSFAASDGVDRYLLALSWEPAFCAAHASKAECRDETPDSFSATHLVLHGLWPSRKHVHNFEYCGVDGAVVSSDKRGKWKNLPPINLGAAENDLAKLMPGSASGLALHEWYKHGTCTDLSPRDYFGAAERLVELADDSAIGKFVSSHVGATVGRGEFESALAATFGNSWARSVTYSCSSARGAATLAEIRVMLTPNLPTQSLMSGLDPAGHSKAPHCPDAFQIVAEQ